MFAENYVILCNQHCTYWLSRSVLGHISFPNVLMYGMYTSSELSSSDIKWTAWFVHDDVIKWKYFPRYWPFVRGIHRSPVKSPHKGQWRGALMFSLIWVWINGWVNNREAGDLRRYRAHYGVTVMVGSIRCGRIINQMIRLSFLNVILR